MGPVPYPVDDEARIEPVFVEWLMGLPTGWTSTITARTKRLAALGNAVVPLQGAVAFGILADLESRF